MRLVVIILLSVAIMPLVAEVNWGEWPKHGQSWTDDQLLMLIVVAYHVEHEYTNDNPEVMLPENQFSRALLFAFYYNNTMYDISGNTKMSCRIIESPSTNGRGSYFYNRVYSPAKMGASGYSPDEGSWSLVVPRLYGERLELSNPDADFDEYYSSANDVDVTDKYLHWNGKIFDWPNGLTTKTIAGYIRHSK